MSEQKTELNTQQSNENAQNDSENKKNGKVTRAIVGGVLGAAAGFFMKPSKAGEAGVDVKEKAGKAEDKLKDWKDQTKEKTGKLAQNVKNKVKIGSNSSEKEEVDEETPSIEGADLSQKQLESSVGEVTTTEEAGQSKAEEQPKGEEQSKEEEQSSSDDSKPKSQSDSNESKGEEQKKQQPEDSQGKTKLTVNDDTTK